MLTTLGELAKRGELEFSDGYRTKGSEYAPSGYRIIRAGDVNGSCIDFSGPDFVSSTRRQAIGSKAVLPGDVVLTTKGTVGRTARVRGVPEPAVYSPQLCYFRPTTERLDSGYLFHWLSSPEFVHQSTSMKSSTDMAPYISLSQLGGTRITLPPLPEQQAIAEVLGALDDKIAGNRSVAETSAQLALTHYLQMSHSVIETTRLGDIAALVLGGTPSKDHPEYWTPGGSIPWLASGKANEDRILEPTSWISTEALKSSATKMMPRRATVIAITGATLGQVGRLEISACGNQSLVGVWSLETGLNDWIHCAIKSSMAQLVRKATGGAQQHVNKNDVASMIIPMPGETLLEEFSRRASSLFEGAAAADRESLLLSSMRDTLLPALMDGTIRVKDAIATAEEVL